MTTINAPYDYGQVNNISMVKILYSNKSFFNLSNPLEMINLKSPALKSQFLIPMKTMIKILALLILFFNGFGALYGGWNLIRHPNGESVDLDLNLLRNSPFHNYLIPGIILFMTNGIFSLMILTAIILNHKKQAWLILGQGMILSGWMIVQLILIPGINYLQVIYCFAGLLLILCGLLLIQIEKRSSF